MLRRGERVLRGSRAARCSAMGMLEFPGLMDFFVAEQAIEGEGTVLLHQLPAGQDAREKRRLDGLCRLRLGQSLRETLDLRFEGTLGGYVFRRVHGPTVPVVARRNA